MILVSNPPTSRPFGPSLEDTPPEKVGRVFLPPAEVLRRLVPAPPPPVPAARPTPPPASPKLKDRISIGPPVNARQKGPLILRREDDLTQVPKGEPDAAPTPAQAAPAETRQAGGGSPQVPGREGLRLPPGIGRDLARGSEGSTGRPGPEGPSIASSLRNLDERLQRDARLGLPTGTGQKLHGLFFDPQGADFTSWINHFKNEVYRNWIVPTPALMGFKGHVDFEFTVERDGSVSSLRLLKSSGTPALDKAAQNALQGGRFLPLPSDFGPPRVTMQVGFYYNEAPQGT
jgi:protein TonB